jgi:hypothetical protein
MTDTIKTGTILIAEGAISPESLLFESEPYAYGWRLVKKLDSKGGRAFEIVVYKSPLGETK